MSKVNWNIRREGQAWTEAEALARLRLFPAKAEMVAGKLFWSHEERTTALALLLESLGVDEAVKLGDPELWREAISRLGDG